MNDPLRIGIIVATKGRPHAVTELLRSLEAQTLAPSLVLVSATCAEDIEATHESSLPLQYMFGEAGSSCQRNRALDRLGNGVDLVVFFDDDFAPSSTWLKNCAEVFRARADVVGISGALLKDGVKADEITWDEVQLLTGGESLVPASQRHDDCQRGLVQHSQRAGGQRFKSDLAGKAHRPPWTF